VGHDTLAAAGGLALLVLFQPAREEVRLGQAYALLLLGEVALLWAYLARRERTAGLLLGLLLSVKTAGLLLPALLLARRRWRALGWTLLAVALVIGLSLPWLGPAAWRTYAGLLPGFGARPELAVTAYQDLPGLVWHLLRPDPRWNSAPVLAAPRLAAALAIALPLTLMAATFLVTWRADPRCRRADALAFAAWMTLTIILSPVSEDYHHTLLLAPIAILLAYWRDARPGRPALIALAFGVALIGAPLPYKDPALSAGARALLAYPKLYGALALWAVALSALRRPAQRAAQVASAALPAPQPEAAR
jgi:hypothetical protein